MGLERWLFVPKTFLIKLFIFIFSSYLIIPFIIKSLTPYFGLDKYPYLNFFNSHYILFCMFLIFAVIERKKLMQFDHKVDKKQAIIFSVLFFICFVLFLNIGSMIDFLYNHNFDSSIFNFISVYLTYFLIFVFLFLALFGIKFILQFRKGILIIISITILFYLLSLALFLNGTWFANITAKIAYLVLSLSHANLFFDYNAISEPVIVINDVPITIGIACSGIESLTIFISLFIAFILFIWKKVDKINAIIFLVIGMIGTFFVNLLRVYILVLIGSHNQELTLRLFHSNLGWIFLAGFYAVFLYFGYGKIIKKN